MEKEVATVNVRLVPQVKHRYLVKRGADVHDLATLAIVHVGPPIARPGVSASPGKWLPARPGHALHGWRESGKVNFLRGGTLHADGRNEQSGDLDKMGQVGQAVRSTSITRSAPSMN